MQGQRLIRALTPIAAGALLLYAALGPGAAAAFPDAGPPPADDPATIHFCLPPWQRGQDVDDIRRRYRPLLDYLGARLGVRVELVAGKSYADTINYLASGRVQFASVSPVPLAEAQRLNPSVKLLLVEQSWSADHSSKTDGYVAAIVALRSREELKTVADLRGRPFGFVARESTSGFVFPNAMLQAAGIDYATFFSAYFFLGSHPRVTDALVAGSIDAGATWDFNLAEARKKHGDVFRVLHEERIPNLAIAIHPSLGEARTRLLREALLSAEPTLFTGLPTAGYVERPESFYDGVRKMLPAKAP
jgi:phosphonate transport system substrate-binding protein